MSLGNSFSPFFVYHPAEIRRTVDCSEDIFLDLLMLWLLYHHILFAFRDCATYLCFAGTANCLCYLWWIVKDVKPTHYAFPSNLDCSLLWQNRAERERFLSQLEVSKGLWIMCDGVEDNEGCWNVSEQCCRICQAATTLKTVSHRHCLL